MKRGTKRAPAHVKPAKTNAPQAAPVTECTATILGKTLVVTGWEDDKWLLAGGSRYGFIPLSATGPGFRSQRLIEISLLRLDGGEWLLDGQPLDQLAKAESEAISIAWLKNPNAPSPTTWRRFMLRRFLDGNPLGMPYDPEGRFDGKDKECVRAVAWFEGEDVDGDPVLLRDFWKDLRPIVQEGTATKLKVASPHESHIKAIAADVKVLTSRKAERDRRTYSRAAKAKAKWFGHERELSQMAKHARKFLKRDSRNQVIRGTLTAAIEQGKGWWKRQDFADPKLSGLLDNQNKQWLRRVILKDWREEKPRLD